MRYPDARILVFAKTPRPGQVKTRLVPRLGVQGAADLHAALVYRTLRIATSGPLSPVALWCAPSRDDPFFDSCARRYPVTLRTQRGADLGARMHHAFVDTLRDAERAILIGTDCPSWSPTLLAEALQSLDDTALDAVLTPAFDGGYVLIGLKQPAAFLFDRMPWGGADVLDTTRLRLRDAGWRWYETRALPDVDEPEDLDRLPDDLKPASN